MAQQENKGHKRKDERAQEETEQHMDSKMVIQYPFIG